jgi:Ca2+-binding RTX toxin-like protein
VGGGWGDGGQTASQRFIYNLSNGDLFFDPDGTGVADWPRRSPT